MYDLKHLPNGKTHFYCPQAFLSLDFQGRDGISDMKSCMLLQMMQPGTLRHLPVMLVCSCILGRSPDGNDAVHQA